MKKANILFQQDFFSGGNTTAFIKNKATKWSSVSLEKLIILQFHSDFSYFSVPTRPSRCKVVVYEIPYVWELVLQGQKDRSVTAEIVRGNSYKTETTVEGALFTNV